MEGIVLQLGYLTIVVIVAAWGIHRAVKENTAAVREQTRLMQRMGA